MEKQMKHAIRTALIFGMISFFGTASPKVALGDEAFKPLLGINVGAASYNNSVGTKLTYGGRAAVRYGDLELGVDYRTAKLQNDNTTSTSVDIAYLLGEFDYRMAMGGGHFAVGLEAGSGKVTTNLNFGFVSISGNSEENFAFGPKVSYSIPLSEHFEVGASVDYLTVLTSSKINSIGILANAAYLF